MSVLLDIPQMEGVPPELVRVLNDRLRRLEQAAASQSVPAPVPVPAAVPVVAGDGVLTGTHAARLLLDPSSYAEGTEYYEQDRDARYQVQVVSGVNAWVWTDGEMRGTLSPDQRPGDLGTDDTGWLFRTTDYGFRYRWTGAAWALVYDLGLAVPDTHANRLALTPPFRGAQWLETDRGNVAYVAAGAPLAWKYAGGTMQGTFAGIPGDLGADDEGFLYLVTTGTGGVEYYHLIRWTGAAWEWGPGETGAHPVDGFPVAPERGWQLCDGSATTYLAMVAGVPTEAAFTTEDYVSAAAKGAYLKFGSPYAAAVAATAPGISGDTADESAHTHAKGTLAADNATLTTTNLGAAAALGVVTQAVHNHAISGSTAAGSAHKHGKGTLAADTAGEPRHGVLLPYFRR